MNHFAPAEENNRLDQLALNAMTTGDSRRLYDTCIEHRISMCGMVPATIVMEALRQTTPAIVPQLIDHTHSGVTSGDNTRVVGYAGVVIA
jgi:AmmeMemoRadiSam system protein B